MQVNAYIRMDIIIKIYLMIFRNSIQTMYVLTRYNPFVDSIEHTGYVDLNWCMRTKIFR